MHRLLRPCLALVCLAACPADDDDDDATAGETTAPTTDPTMTTSSPTTTTTSPGESSTDDPTVDPSDTTSDDSDPTDVSTTGDTTAADDASTSGAPADLCDPPDADPCIACAQANCCEAYSACYGDPDCVCAVDCILETMDYATCLGPKCNSPEPTPAMDIGICYGTTCAAECGFGG